VPPADHWDEGFGLYDLVGRRLMDRYEIEEGVGHGGMSVVYRAQDMRLHRPVCIKVFHKLDHQSPTFHAVYEHFVQEAFALSRLRHPNTIRIYDFGYLDDPNKSPYHVSEYLDGGTLVGRVRRKKQLPLEEAIAILDPVGGALTEAHACGIVHRDIKPSNILFGRVGATEVVKLADFGIAKANADDDRTPLPFRASDTGELVRQGVLLFSVGWAAPEQIRGQEVGPAADVYSLGLCAAYMLSGKQVYAGDDLMELLSARFEGDKRFDATLDRFEIDPPVAEVIRRACRESPDARFRSVDDLVKAFRALAEEPVTSESHPVKGQSTTPTLILESLDDTVRVAAGRRVRIVRVPGKDPVTLGGPGSVVQTAGRLQLRAFPIKERDLKLHVKGMNCFVSRVGGRPSPAVDLDTDAALELSAPGGKSVDKLRVQFGRIVEGTRSFDLGGGILGVRLSVAPRVVVLDYGPSRELVILVRERS
jgi:serine/threonine-protein kinase